MAGRAPTTIEEKVRRQTKAIQFSVHGILAHGGTFNCVAKVRGITGNVRVIVRTRSAFAEGWAMSVLLDNRRIDGIDWERVVKDHWDKRCSGWHRHICKDGSADKHKECLQKFAPTTPADFIVEGFKLLKVKLGRSAQHDRLLFDQQALSEYLLANVDVQQVRDMCVATIPFTTVDNRWIDIFIESRQADYFLIHDGGKAVNELILQGVKITPMVEKDLGIIAQRMGVAYSDEMFQDGGKIGQIAEKAYAIGMSSALAMAQLLERVDIAAEDPLEGQIGTLLRKWGGTKAQIKRGVKVQGGLKQHSFDFVVSPRKEGAIYRVVDSESDGRRSLRR